MNHFSKLRNAYAVAAHFKTGAGIHKNKAKETQAAKTSTRDYYSEYQQEQHYHNKSNNNDD